MLRRKDSITGIGIILFCIAISVFVVMDGKGKEQKIHNWASQEGYEIVSLEESNFDKGPFWTKDNSQKIYRIQVRDKHNRPKSIWLRVGSWLDVQEEK